MLPNQYFQNFKGENAMISGRKLKYSNLRRIPATNRGRYFWGEQYCKPMKKSFQCNSKFCWRDQVMNALETVPGRNDVINVHELRQIVRRLKNKKAVGNITMEFHLKSMSLQLSDCWPWCQYCFLVICLPVSYRIPLWRSDHTATEVQI